MQFNQEVIVHGIKESKGSFEGRAFDSTIFHIEADLKENGAGRSLGRATTPMKCGTSQDFDKWAHLEKHFPIKAVAVFEIQASGKGETSLQMVAIRPMESVSKAAAAAK